MATNRTFDMNALRARFKSNTRTTTRSNTPSDSRYYPFFLAEVGTESIVRFVPDKNEDNQWFFLERDLHQIPVNGEIKKVPCLKMYGHASCPMCESSRLYYKKEGKQSATGKQLYRKRDWLSQVYVKKDALPVNAEANENFEGKVKAVVVTSQVYEAIDISLEDVDEPPHLYKGGCDFIIRPTQDGNYRSYVRSRFAKSPSDLDDDIIDYIEASIVDLRTLLPAEPNIDDVNGYLNSFLSGSDYTPSNDSQETHESVSSTSDLLQATAPVQKPAAQAAPAAAVSISSTDEDEEAEAVLERMRQARRARSAG
jgi:hypothetical protein